MTRALTVSICSAVATLTPIERTPVDADPVKYRLSVETGIITWSSWLVDVVVPFAWRIPTSSNW